MHFSNFNIQNTALANYSTMDATMTQIPNNTSVIDTASMSSVGISSTETPPPGYMSEDGDPMDQNDNLSEFIVGDRTTFFIAMCWDVKEAQN